ncbi:MAG: hypothetical protein HFG38_12280, partial [Eubacterium sp.]|nr:hypothetical protein [Eubacterium sp.]
MRRIVKTLFYVFLLGIFISLPVQVQAKMKITTPNKVRVRSSESKKLKVTWKKVKKADGYQIYEYNKSNKKFKKIADVDGKTRLWKSGNTKKVHTYKVRAYKKSGKTGALTIVPVSSSRQTGHARTSCMYWIRSTFAGV